MEASNRAIVIQYSGLEVPDSTIQELITWLSQNGIILSGIASVKQLNETDLANAIVASVYKTEKPTTELLNAMNILTSFVQDSASATTTDIVTSLLNSMHSSLQAANGIKKAVTTVIKNKKMCNTYLSIQYMEAVKILHELLSKNV